MAVDLQVDGAVATLRLDRPESGNRLDAQTLAELLDAFVRLAADESVQVLVLGASGPDFCLGREKDPPGKRTAGQISRQFTAIQEVNEALQRLPLVTVAAVRGRATGAGLSLAARCDIVVAADDARLSFPEVPHGVPPTIVLSHYRYVLPRSVLGDLIFTGRELAGAEAVSAGIAARAVPDAEVEQTAVAIAAQVASYDAATVRMVKDFLVRTDGLSPRDAPALGIALYSVEMGSRG